MDNHSVTLNRIIMKKHLYYAGMLLLGMLVTTGCSNEESLEQVSSNGKLYQAVIENTSIARTSVSDEYKVLWSAEDAFTVFEESEKVATLTLIQGDGTTSGKFQSDVNKTLTDGAVALFPANESLGYTFKASYDSRETDAPMLGSYTNGTFTFNLLTAMVRVVVADVPAGNVTLTLSSESLNLTGDATISNSALAAPTTGTKEVTVTLANSEGGTLTFDVPVPVQNYTDGLKILVKSGQTKVLNKETNAFNAAAGTLYLFGAKYVAAEEAATSLQAAIDASTEGEVIVLTGEEQEIEVPSLSVGTGKTAALDLNGKKLKLGAAASTYVAPRAAEGTGAGLVNNGILTITNGDIEYTYGDYVTTGQKIGAIVNMKGGQLTLDNVNVTSDIYCVMTYGSWDKTTLEANMESEATTTTIIKGGEYISSGEFHSTSGAHIYAIYAEDYGKTTIEEAKITGDGGIVVNCAVVDVKNAEITATDNNTYGIYIIGTANVTVDTETEFNTKSNTSVVAYSGSNAKYGKIVYNGKVLNYADANTTLEVPEGVYVILENHTAAPVLEGKIINRGTLVIRGGSVTYEPTGKTTHAELNSVVAIQNHGILDLSETNVTSSGWAINTYGVWTDGKVLKEQGDPTVKTIISGGKIISTAEAHSEQGAHIYALSVVDNALVSVKNGAEITGDGCIYLNCANAQIEKATLTANCTTSAYCMYLVSAVNVSTTNETSFVSERDGSKVVVYKDKTKYGDIVYNETKISEVPTGCYQVLVE